jgi:MFS family permease
MFGRNAPYIISYALYVVLAVPTALVDNFAGLIVLRFITGVLGSPCLATGPASLGDFTNFIFLPMALLGWTAAAFAGPAIGPLLSGFAVMNENWRWALWPILWLNAPIWLLMFFFAPETYAPNILYRRAHRLRKVTGNTSLKSQSEIDQAGMSIGKVISNQLIKPFEISFKDPSVFFVQAYTSLIYGIYYRSDMPTQPRALLNSKHANALQLLRSLSRRLCARLRLQHRRSQLDIHLHRRGHRVRHRRLRTSPFPCTHSIQSLVYVSLTSSFS